MFPHESLGSMWGIDAAEDDDRDSLPSDAAGLEGWVSTSCYVVWF